MAKYRLNKDHFLQDNKRGIEPRLHSKGDVIDWSGAPSLAMTPLDKEGKEAKAARDAERKAFRERPDSGARVGYSEAFARNFEAIQQQEHDEERPITAVQMKKRSRKQQAAAAA